MAPIYMGGYHSEATHVNRRIFEPSKFELSIFEPLDILLMIQCSLFVCSVVSLFKHKKVNKLPIRNNFIQKQTRKQIQTRNSNTKTNTKTNSNSNSKPKPKPKYEWTY
jgi:hypothetical protein